MTRSVLFLSLALFFSCSEPKKETAETIPVQSKNGITLVPVTDSPAFEGAALRYDDEGIRISGNTVAFSFDVEKYTLGEQTPDASTKGIANSGMGQHIHVILNNGPYSAHYVDELEMELEDGSYTMLAFLSRSYHESVKSRRAFVTDQFVVGDGEVQAIDFSKPHLFYSRPKGTYTGAAEIENLMLDFYLLGVRLGDTGNVVEATINGTTFTLSHWVPYIIQGLAPGEVTITLALKDKDGELFPSPYNPVERTVLLKE